MLIFESALVLVSTIVVTYYLLEVYECLRASKAFEKMYRK